MKSQLIRELKYVKADLMVGEDVEGIRRKCKLYLGEALSTMPKKTSERRTYGEGMRDLVNRVRDDMGVPKDGTADNKFLALLRKDFAAGRDDLSDFLIRKYAAEHPLHKIPDLGPIYRGGRSVLLQDLTHETSGLQTVSVYPAFDDGWKAGRLVVAPENLKITDQSGAAGGDAFYARGDSSLEYWIGHIVQAPATGRRFKKGEAVGVIANIPYSEGGPHVHCGINAMPLIGHDFLHHKNYTHGAPTVGEQLRKWAQT